MKDKRFKGLKKRQFFIETETFYHQANGITVCRAKVVFPMPILNWQFQEIIQKRFPNLELDYFDAKGSFKTEIIGKATVSTDDTFNVDKGHQIAYSKMLVKAYRIAERIQNSFKMWLLKTSITATLNEDYLRSMANREQYYIDSI